MVAVGLGMGDRGGRRDLPALLPALPASPGHLLLGGRRAEELAARVLRTESGAVRRAERRTRAEMPELGVRAARRRGRTARWPASRLDLLAGQRRDLRRHLAARAYALVSFAPILKHGIFPLAEILLRRAARSGHRESGTSTPVEIEFAVNLSVP